MIFEFVSFYTTVIDVELNIVQEQFNQFSPMKALPTFERCIKIQKYIHFNAFNMLYSGANHNKSPLLPEMHKNLTLENLAGLAAVFLPKLRRNSSNSGI